MNLLTKIAFTLASPVMVPLTHGMTFGKWMKEVWGKPEEKEDQ